MQRYRLDIEYDGTGYYGWQSQFELPSIQQAIEEAIALYTKENVSLKAAGRTDAGVHAMQQVAHFDLPGDKLRDTSEIAGAINFYLERAGHRIAILSASVVEPDFSARFHAKKRHYLYRIIQRRAPLVLEAKRAWAVPRHLNVPLMQLCAQILVGTHDFSSFRSTQCQAKSPVRTIDSITITRREHQLIELHIVAKSFLHNQIRAFTGSLYNIGIGRWDMGDLKKVLEQRKRSAAGQNAPPHGLYLAKVLY